MKKIHTTAVIAWSALITVVATLVFESGCKENSSEKSTASDTVYASLDPHTGYVGMETCRECHGSIYDSFIQTGMGKSFDKASAYKSSGDFSKHKPVYDPVHDFYYLPFWDKDSLRIMEFRMEGKDTIHKRVETVSYIVGSGQHTNSHIMNTFGYLNQMPLTFYTQKGVWDLPPGFEKGGNTRFNRLIGIECMSCHNSYPQFIKGSENRYDFVEKGIGCERCHGPGSKHVTEKRRGKIIDISSSIDYSIVNPAKLPVKLQLDICQRCHIQGNAVLNEGKSFFDFRPGMKLSDVMHVYMPVYEGRKDEHIMASHAERMKLSKCFTESVRSAEKAGKSLKPYRNALTCVTCHDPHVSVRVTGDETFNNACRNCHQAGKQKLCSDDQKKMEAKKFNCIQCHMPSNGSLDIPHVSVHDHYIRKPVDEKVKSDIRKFIGIACINEPVPDPVSKGRAYIAYYEKFGFNKFALDSAKKYFPYESPELLNKNYRDVIHIMFLEKNYSDIIRIISMKPGILKELKTPSFDNRDAWAAYRIGEAFAAEGINTEALKYFEVANRLAPHVIDFINKYTSALAGAGMNLKAKNILEQLVYEYPKNATSLANLGFLVLILDHDTARAGSLYEKALNCDPDHEQAIVNKAGLLSFRGNNREAIRILSIYLKRHPGAEKAKAALEQIGRI